MFRCPICLDDVWMPPVHTQHKACFVRLRGCPYVPIHVDAPCQSTAQRKHALLDLGVSICPHTFGCPHMFGCPMYSWMPLVCLDSTICLDALHMFGCPTVCLDAA